MPKTKKGAAEKAAVVVAPMFDDEKLLTTHEAAKLIQVTPSSVVKWVNEGTLVSYRTPGGHRRIPVAELKVFITKNKMYMPKILQG